MYEMTIEITFDDGSTARWTVNTTERTIDRVTNAIEAEIGPPQTIAA